jgi:hypothetical protein
MSVNKPVAGDGDTCADQRAGRQDHESKERNVTFDAVTNPPAVHRGYAAALARRSRVPAYSAPFLYIVNAAPRSR